MSREFFEKTNNLGRVADTGIEEREINAMLQLEFHEVSLLKPDKAVQLAEMMQLSDFVILSRPDFGKGKYIPLQITLVVHDIGT